MRGVRRQVRVLGVLAGAGLLAGCVATDPAPSGRRPVDPVLVGQDPVPRVHLFENNSSALIAWRRAGVRERILVHLDGHGDLDWLPEETIVRLAAATPEELEDLELHPYSVEGDTLDRFGIWNFIYPASRMGIVREMIWVVPDGTLGSLAAAQSLVRELLVRKLQMIQFEELRAMRFHPGMVRGEVLGLPITICELDNLPPIDEPVLLDIDLDYFTTRSALTQYVTDRPWTSPERVVRALWEKRIHTDLVTICFSTIGGYMPSSGRWMGHALVEQLRFPGADRARGDPTAATENRQGLDLTAEVRRYRELVDRHPEDASMWYGLAEALRATGQAEAASDAAARAGELDPLLLHAELFAADRLWMNEGYEAALARYERYIARFPDGPFTTYAKRRRAGCLMRTRRDDEAVAAYRQVVELAPSHADSRLDLGILLREQGRMAEAIEQMLAARRILPQRGTYALALGTTYLLDGQTDLAIQHLEFAVKRQPCVPATRGNLSNALVQNGRYQEAAQHLRIALMLQPNSPRFQVLAAQLNRRGVQVTPVSAP